MKFLNCITCGKEKIKRAQRSARCASCAKTVSNTGKILSIEHRRALSISQGGNGDLNNKRKDLRKWSYLVRERDNECVHCHSKENLEAHHLLRKATFPQFATELWNGLTLCRPCHKITHGK